MRHSKKSNSGFTLVELIIAMAVLAFFMTAVVSLMSSSILTNKKAKADITVSTTAQQTYNQLSDTIIQARNVVVIGYKNDETTLKYFVKEKETLQPKVASGGAAKTPAQMAQEYILEDSLTVTPVFATTTSPGGVTSPGAVGGNVEYFSNLKKDDKIYVRKLIIDTAEPIDTSNISGSVTIEAIGTDITDNFTGDPVKVKKLEYATSVSTSAITGSAVYAYSGSAVTSTRATAEYDTFDTIRNVYTFDGKNLYYERKYRFMDTLSDYISDWSTVSKKNVCLYNRGFDTKEITGASGATEEITDCYLLIDASGAIGIQMNFEDKNMIYTTDGMINIRNSDVLKARK